VLGTVRHSQYNYIYEKYCTAGQQTAYLYTLPACQWSTAQLKSDFVSQTEENGSGVTLNSGDVQADSGKNCNSNRPQGSNTSNSFVSVSSLLGQCGKPLVGGDSVATNPGPNVPGSPYNCGDNMELVNGNNQNSYLKHVLDQCSSDPKKGCGDGHVDDFSSTQQCSGLGDLPGSPYWSVDDQ